MNPMNQTPAQCPHASTEDYGSRLVRCRDCGRIVPRSSALSFERVLVPDRLCLLPVDDQQDGVTFAHTVLRCPQSRGLLEEVLQLPTSPVPDRTLSYVARLPDGRTGYGVLSPTNMCGAPYTMVSGGALLACLQEHCPAHPVTAYFAAARLAGQAVDVILDWY